MSRRDAIQNEISRLGQSQRERVDGALAPHAVDVDERAPADLMLFLKGLSHLIGYYRDVPTAAAGDWHDFFAEVTDRARAAAMLDAADGDAPPHLALLMAFAKLYEFPREAINRFTGNHRDFFFQRVLRFAPRAAVPDRAHVLIEPRKGAAPAVLTPAHLFSAGKDATKVERIYEPVRDVVIRPCKVDRLHALFVDGRDGGSVRFAPIANSLDGLGAPLTPEAPTWAPFGDSSLPTGPVGFALAAPVLRMREGERSVTLSLDLTRSDGAPIDPGALASSFQVFITGEKSWLGPYEASGAARGDQVALTFRIPPADKAVVDYAPAVHGGNYGASTPVVQLLLRASAPLGYAATRGLFLRRARVAVAVDGVTSLTLESDAGPLNPKRPFLPFGPQPIRGSRFMVGYPEALSKSLTRLTLKVTWHGLPGDLAAHYRGYGQGVGSASFTAGAAFQDGRGSPRPPRTVALFNVSGAESTLDLTGDLSPTSTWLTLGQQVFLLSYAGSALSSRYGRALALLHPTVARPAGTRPEAREGFITLDLDRDFLHELYRRKTLENLLNATRVDPAPAALNEPYTPTVRSLTLSYSAESAEASLDAETLAAFSSTEVSFFHVGCFGTRREHGFLRRGLAHVADKRVPLLPTYDSEGEMLIGLAGLRAGDSASLLFQVAEGSADPDVDGWPAVEWSVLGDDHWAALRAGERALDTTNDLRTSGIVALIVPRAATTDNTFLPAGRVWLRAAVRDHAASFSRLLAVAPNAVEVRFHDRGNDPALLGAASPAGTITRMKAPPAVVQSVAQPYATFGARPAETADAMAVRASERLRHKNRCVSPWDYERVVLDAFPEVYRARCIPHAAPGRWNAPGHVLVVVIPDLRNKNARDPLRPRLDADTLARITAHLKRRAGMQVEVKTVNPRYEPVQLDFKVRFHDGYEFDAWSERLKAELTAFLSPWATDDGREPGFGGRIYRSAVLDFVEERACVDYITDFKMNVGGQDVPEAQARTPDTILVSHPDHTVGRAPGQP